MAALFFAGKCLSLYIYTGMKHLIISILLLVASVSAFPQNRNTMQFTLPSIPDSLRTVEGRFNYVVKNYWTNFDFTDHRYINSRAAEEALVNYIDLLSRLPLEKGGSHMQEFLAQTSVDTTMQTHLCGILRRYMVNYDSPMRNHPLYLYAAGYLSEKALDLTVKYNAVQDIALLSINNEGDVALDFTYFLPDGTGCRMHQTESPYTLLFFYNPTCRSCQGIIEALKTSHAINGALEGGKLKLLAIYTQDNSPVWQEFIKSVPPKWINGCDNGMKLISENIYDLRNLPVFYLVDSDKRVLLKDLPLSGIEEHFK